MAKKEFTRQSLRDLGIEEETVDKIMAAHVAVVDGLKADRDHYREEAEKTDDLQKQLEAAQKSAKNADGKAYKDLYESLVTENKNRDTRKTKEAAYRSALKTIGVSDQYLDLLVKANRDDVDNLELEGTEIKDADKYTEGLKESLKDYIAKKKTEGQNVKNPPDGSGGDEITKETFARMSYRERVKLYDDNPELYKELTQ